MEGNYGLNGKVTNSVGSNAVMTVLLLSSLLRFLFLLTFRMILPHRVSLD